MKAVSFRPSLCLTVVLFTLYGVAIFWLHRTDVYHQHFFEHGPLLIFYNLARITFMAVSLFWLIYWAGFACLRACGDIATLPVSSRYVLGFFIGAGLWHMLLFPIGLAGFYSFAVAVGITLGMFPAVAAASGRVALRKPARRLSRFLSLPGSAHQIGVLAFLLAAVTLLVAKMLYPGGGDDYFHHYFFYDRAVVESGNLLSATKSEFYFLLFQGCGLKLPLDAAYRPAGPGSLSTGCFVLMGALLVFLLVKRQSGESLWPWLAATLFLVLQIYIRGKGLGMWGQLQKLHELCQQSPRSRCSGA